MKRILVLTAALTVAAAGPRAQTGTSELGTINFPTSAKPAAQAPFLVGTKALYNFEFDIAAEAFQQSQKVDPGFALAYWGEAMRRRLRARNAISWNRWKCCSAPATSWRATSRTPG